MPYDSNGNLTNTKTPTTNNTMTYDKENRLTKEENGVKLSPTKWAVSSEEYTYDGDGLKRSKSSLGVSLTTLIWDGDEYLGKDGTL